MYIQCVCVCVCVCVYIHMYIYIYTYRCRYIDTSQIVATASLHQMLLPPQEGGGGGVSTRSTISDRRATGEHLM
jgi:hypothetical protein